jgi:hypothetical protein
MPFKNGCVVGGEGVRRDLLHPPPPSNFGISHMFIILKNEMKYSFKVHFMHFV